MIYRFVRAPEAIERALAALPGFQQAPQVTRNLMQCARGHHAAAVGDHAGAADRFRDAVAAMRDGHYALQEHETLPWFVSALVRAGRLDEAAAEIDGASQPAFAGNSRLQGHMLHCRALLEYARGNLPRALALLRTLLSSRVSPLWRHWALLDAAYLLAEQRDVEEAKRLLAQVDSRHLAEQRVGYAVASFVASVAGEHVEAARRHSRYLAGRRVGPPDPFELLDAWSVAGRAAVLPSRL
jgi:tetratricopeptide (TPR) repeat protein